MITRHHVPWMQACLKLRTLPQLHATCSRSISVLNKKKNSATATQQDRNKINESILRPKTPCRTRFAPSPTGYLHLGSLRTALYNYLLAKATKGRFILRLEDTDQNRLVADAEQKLYDDLRWAGLSWNEGPDVGGPYGPYRQSDRLSLYNEHSDRLIQQGKAYRCFCPPEALAAIHVEHQSKFTLPPNPCIQISAEESSERAAKGEPYCVIFKASPAPTEVQDLVYGSYKKNQPENDFVLRKTDGFPTYHFANVVDDHAMKITHVIRGAEWLVSTPKHVQLYEALQWEPPTFAHVGLLVDENRRKLSKRDKGVDMSFYKEENIMPEALLNFAVLLGWSPGQAKNEVLTLKDMVEKFRLKFTKGNITVQLPGKIRFLDASHKMNLLRQQPPDLPRVWKYILKDLEKAIAAYAAEEQSQFDRTTEAEEEPRLTRRASAAFSTASRKIQDPLYFIELLRMQSRGSTFEYDVKNLRYLMWRIPRPHLARQLGSGGLLHIVLGNKKQQGEEAEAGVEAASACALIADVLKLVARQLEQYPADAPWTADEIPLSIPQVWKILAARFEPKTDAEASTEGPTRVTSTVYGEILRWALMGSDPSPANKMAVEFLGRWESVERIRTAAQVAAQLAEGPPLTPWG